MATAFVTSLVVRDDATPAQGRLEERAASVRLLCVDSKATSIEGCAPKAPAPSFTEDVELKECRSEPAKTTVPPIVWLLLLVCLLTYGSVAPLFKRIDGPTPLLKATWQATGALLWMAPLHLFTVARSAKGKLVEFVSPRIALAVVACGFFQAGGALTWFWALEHTSVTHACLLHETHPLIMIALHCVCKARGERPTQLQMLGTVVGFGSITGIALSNSAPGSQVTLVGDMVALSGAFMWCGYLTVGKTLVERIPSGLYVFWTYVVYLCVSVVACCALERPWEMGYDASVFFFPLQGREVAVGIILSSAFAAIGMSLLNHLLKYFSSSVMSVSLLSEPVVASILAVALSMEPPPPVLTYVLGAVLLLSTALVITAPAASPLGSTVRSKEDVLEQGFNDNYHPLPESGECGGDPHAHTYPLPPLMVASFSTSTISSLQSSDSIVSMSKPDP